MCEVGGGGKASDANARCGENMSFQGKTCTFYLSTVKLATCLTPTRAAPLSCTEQMKW